MNEEKLGNDLISDNSSIIKNEEDGQTMDFNKFMAITLTLCTILAI